MEYIIDNGLFEDINHCAKILMNEYNNNILNEGWSLEDSIKCCNFYFKLQSDLFFVAKKDKKVIGFIFAYIKPWAGGNYLVLQELCVDFQFRCNSIAKTLLRTMILKAVKEYNIIQIKAETYGTAQEMPFSWYKRLGFNISKDTYLIGGSPKIVLQKLS